MRLGHSWPLSVKAVATALDRYLTGFLYVLRPYRLYRGLQVMSHPWIGQWVWRVGLRGPSYVEAVSQTPAELSRTLRNRESRQGTDRPPEDPLQADTMKSLLWSLLCCASLLLSDVQATYHHLSAVDPQVIAAQSYAQTRNNGRPPHRTLNPASKSYWALCYFFTLQFNLCSGKGRSYKHSTFTRVA